MSKMVQSVGSMMGAGMKGLMGLADGYMNPDSDSESDSGLADDRAPTRNTSEQREPGQSTPVSIPSQSTPASSQPSIPSSNASNASAASASSTSADAFATPKSFIKTVGVASGWIHLQSTYLDENDQDGSRTVRSFGVKSIVDTEVNVVISSDLGGQLLFWLGDDDKPPSSSASTSSSVSSASTPSTSLHISLKAQSTVKVFFAFQPTSASPTSSKHASIIGELDDENIDTPKIMAEDSSSIDLSPMSSPVASTISTASSSLTGSKKAPNAVNRRNEPIHRSFSVHGLITLRAHSTTANHPGGNQLLNLPFFATVCKSLFTAATIDPVSGLASGHQQSNGQVTIDFGSDSVVGKEYHRDILLVNRSECELMWSTAVVSSEHKDAVWFSLRDLDSENVFGVDTSSQPVPLPALSSRHLRLELRVKTAIDEFEFDFVISNTNHTGNTVTCRAIGSAQADTQASFVRVTTGNTLDFGQISDGVWAKKLTSIKNTSSRPVDVKLSSTPGYDVIFRLAGFVGEDADEIDERPRPAKKTSDSGGLSRTSTREDHRGRQTSSHSSSRAPSVSSSSDRHLDSSSLGQSSGLKPTPTNRETDLNSLNSLHGSSRPPSRSLSRQTSHSSYRYHAGDSDDEGVEPPFFGGGEVLSHPSSSNINSPSAITGSLPDAPNDIKGNSDEIEELTMRPGTEYRVMICYRPTRDTTSVSAIAGKLRQTNFKVFVDVIDGAKNSAGRARRVINCAAESCTSMIEITSGKRVDFGQVTVGASKNASIAIKNLSALSARIEIAAISKVLHANRNVVVIPPFETVEERLEFFPRRINDKYEKQIFVRNLLNRANDQLIEIRSKNVDVYNLTIHSHLYRILTPSGSNFLDFGPVVINSPTVRSVQLQNLTKAPLILDLSASQPEDVDLYVKLEDAPTPIKTQHQGRYAEDLKGEKTVQGSGELKERFMETLREQGDRSEAKTAKPKVKGKDKADTTTEKDSQSSKQAVGASVASALRKGGRGRPVQLYGNAVVFKDRNLLENHEYLDLASGPPIAAHRTSPRSKKTQMLDAIELEDRSKLSGQHPKIPKLDFAAGAKASGSMSKDVKMKKGKPAHSKASEPSGSPRKAAPHTPPTIATKTMDKIARGSLTEKVVKSPALTAKRKDVKTDILPATEVSNMSVDELLAALEAHDAQKGAITHTSLADEEKFVQRHIALRKELQNLISSGKLVPAQSVSVQAGSTRQLVAVLTPNGSTRPHITTKPKRSDSRIFIRLVDFDRSLLSSPTTDTSLGDLPVRDLVLRSSCVRSILEVQQSSINFGQCEKGEPKSKTIVIHNKSDCIGLFRLRTSGSIASGDLKLGLGRLGVIAAFGRKEIENFNFIPSLGGNYQETLKVENVLDTQNDQNVAIKAMVRRQPALSVDPSNMSFGSIDPKGKMPEAKGFVLTNTSKIERTFIVEVDSAQSPDQSVASYAVAPITLSKDDKGGGTALSKGEEEEVETLLQKLKGAQRKGKKDKITKYESRLSELGVSPRASIGSSVPEPPSETPSGLPSGAATPITSEPAQMPDSSSSPVTSLIVTLQPNEKTKILTHLKSLDDITSPLSTTVKVYDRKNTDETLSVQITASPPQQVAISPSTATSAQPNDSDPLHLAIMRHCLQLTLLCPVSQTAFCVGSSIFLPDASPLFPRLKPYFPSFPEDDPDPTGLILGDGYSRQIPGNTHAEANALTNFRAKYADLTKSISPSLPKTSIIPIADNTQGAKSSLPDQSDLASVQTASNVQGSLPPIEEVLAEASCYATMEPCSFRTSGGPSCALELVKAKIKSVYLGVEEPPDFVQCEGVRILQDGGVEVIRVTGLEEECLKAARRGRS